jgi:hypothetical protein
MNNIERLECVYYPGPVPCNSAVLTVLCLVFDKIHFPGAYLPKGDYDKELLRQEIARLEAIKPKSYDTAQLIGILRFLEHRLPLDGILEYPSSSNSIFAISKDEKQRKEGGRLARAIYDVNYPPRENFEPAFSTASVFALPGSDEEVEYAQDFFYQAGAITYAAQNQLPLLDDGSSLALPFRAQYKDNAQSLAALIALESMGLVLPDLPPLTTRELIDFRMENVRELQNFRASMLRYAKALNAQISEDPSLEELDRKTKFFIETEINPALHDLNRDLVNPNRPWYKRMTDGVRITASVATNFLTGGLVGQTAAEGVRNALLSELEGKRDKQEAAKRNGLYYLLKARTIGS